MTKFGIDVALVIVLTALPLVFRRRTVHTLCVAAIVFIQICLLHVGLRLAARNVPLPSQESFRRTVEYAEAWQDGRMATQRNVEAYILPLLLYTFALGVLAMVRPMMKKPEESQQPWL